MIKIPKLISILLLTIVILTIKVSADDIKLSPHQIDIIKKIDYLYSNNKTLKSKFTQITDDGKKLQGFLILSRPFNVRAEYYTNNTIIISNKSTITIQDKITNNKSFIPMDATPIKFIIGDNVSLLDKSKIKIVNFQEIDNSIVVTIVGNKFYNLGVLTMIFDKDTYQVKEWIIINGKNHNTILFDNPEISNKAIPSNIFNVHKIKPIEFNSI